MTHGSELIALRTAALVVALLFSALSQAAAQKAGPPIVVASGTATASAPADSARVNVRWRLREGNIQALRRRDSVIVAFLDPLPKSFSAGAVMVSLPIASESYFSSFPRLTDTVLTEARDTGVTLRGTDAIERAPTLLQRSRLFEGVNVRFGSTCGLDLRQRALAEATRNARASAQVLADAAQLDLVRLLELSMVPFSYDYFPDGMSYGFTTATDDDGTPAPGEAGQAQVTLQARVHMRWEAKPK